MYVRVNGTLRRVRETIVAVGK